MLYGGQPLASTATWTKLMAQLSQVRGMFFCRIAQAIHGHGDDHDDYEVMSKKEMIRE